MKNENKPNGTAPDTTLEKLVRKIAKDVNVLWPILKTLQNIEDSISIFAAQKKRELDAEQAPAEDPQ